MSGVSLEIAHSLFDLKKHEPPRKNRDGSCFYVKELAESFLPIPKRYRS